MSTGMIRRLGPRGAIAAWFVGVGLIIALVLGALGWAISRIHGPSQPSPSYATFAITYTDSGQSHVIRGVMSAHDGSIIWDKPMLSDPMYATVANGVYYTGGAYNGSASGVTAYRISDGSVLASYTPPSATNIRPLVVTHGLLLYTDIDGYTPNFTGTIYALNIATHTLAWRTSASGANLLYGGLYPQVAMNDTTLFLISPNMTVGQYATVTALRLSDGATLWSRTINSSSNGVLTTKGEASWLSAGPDGVYIADTRGAMIALRASDGATLWNTKPLATVDLSAAVTYSGSNLYVCQTGGGTSAHPLLALDPATGQTRWRATLSTCGGQLSETGGVLYAAANDLTALRASDGAVLWDDSPLAGDVGYRSLYIADGVVIGAATLIGGPAPVCSINVLQGRSSTCQSTGYIAAFNGENGSIYWRKDVTSNPLIISDSWFMPVRPGYYP